MSDFNVFRIRYTLFEMCQGLATGRWFSPGTPVCSTIKRDSHDITEILLKAVLNTITWQNCISLNQIDTIFHIYVYSILHDKTSLMNSESNITSRIKKGNIDFTICVNYQLVVLFPIWFDAFPVLRCQWAL
jgi:hypothetical protein